MGKKEVLRSGYLKAAKKIAKTLKCTKSARRQKPSVSDCRSTRARDGPQFNFSYVTIKPTTLMRRASRLFR